VVHRTLFFLFKRPVSILPPSGVKEHPFFSINYSNNYALQEGMDGQDLTSCVIQKESVYQYVILDQFLF